MDAVQFRVDGKVALITGSGRGIGLAMARSLAAAGAAVAIQDIDVGIASAEAARIRGEGGKAIALGGDLADLKLPQQLAEQTITQLGSIDILINNGAIQSNGSWLEMPLDEMQRQFDCDLLGPIFLSRYAVPHMKARKWGRVINLGSIQQRGANPDMLPYSLSKAALEQFTKALARDLAKHQITVNCIAPGWVNTWRNRDDFRNDQEIKQKGKHIPIGRIGKPDDFSGITLLLCSDAGSYITGQTIFVDGGMSAR
jgi:NAD(P)-dependent dehydrogenase (short-subunit alcohol dehydrogenase family)